jgi:DnaK suppressor protein
LSVDFERFRRLIEAQVTEVDAQISAGEGAAKPVELDQSSVGRLSRMDAISGQAISAEAQRRRQLKLTRARAALARLESGEYGACLECDEPIPERRLELDPATTLCIECAQKRT